MYLNENKNTYKLFIKLNYESKKCTCFQHLVVRVNVLFVTVASEEQKAEKHCFKGYITNKLY
jgi:hypothetical protein